MNFHEQAHGVVQRDASIRQRGGKPSFLITIDTEGDNLWAKSPTITTDNARFLPRFQELCESYSLKPTYLTNYEMALDGAFQELGRDVIARGTGEIGMHLHAWNSPPEHPLTADDYRFHPYLIEYPPDVIRAKVAFMTHLLEDTFGVKMISHRAGRWSFDGVYAKALLENGYRVDCSVTPLISWRPNKGVPDGAGGTDFSRFPRQAYFTDHDDISRPGDSGLLEVPMSTVPGGLGFISRLAGKFLPTRSLPWRVINHFCPQVRWFRPNRSNIGQLVRLLHRCLSEGWPYIEFMLHSSEFMPGGSPVFPREKDIEKLYDDLRQLFSEVGDKFHGETLTEYRETFMARSSVCNAGPDRGGAC